VDERRNDATDHRDHSVIVIPQRSSSGQGSPVLCRQAGRSHGCQPESAIVKVVSMAETRKLRTHQPPAADSSKAISVLALTHHPQVPKRRRLQCRRQQIQPGQDRVGGLLGAKVSYIDDDEFWHARALNRVPAEPLC
jgi:hypothetical protein